MAILTEYAMGGGYPLMQHRGSSLGSMSGLEYFYGKEKKPDLDDPVDYLDKLAMPGGGFGVPVEGLINQTDLLAEYEKRKQLFRMLEEK